MRYPDGGGLTTEGRFRREQVRLQAAGMFEQGIGPVRVAGLLRVSAKSARQWHRAWEAGGAAALASKGPGGTGCRLDEDQLSRLRAALDAGPAVYGWEQDQRWTLKRVAELIMRMFGVPYTLRGVSCLLHRNGFTPQVPAHRAAERDEDAIAEWRTVTWAKIRGLAAATGAWICFEDEAGQTLRPRRARTWGRRGRTPVVRVSGKGSGRVSAAGLACLKAGSPARFFFRLRQHRGRKGERRSMSESDYAALVTAAHRTLGAPVILIWDNLNTHRSRKMRRLAAARAGWLTVFRLPSYAPDLNPVEGAWSSMKAGLGNLSASTLCQLAAAVRSRLTRIQRQRALIAGFLGQTGLTLESQPP